MINLVNLDQTTRGYMLQEVEMDIKANRLYDSPRLTKKGKEDYLGLLRTAIEHHDPHWLAEQLNAQGRMTSLEPGRSRSDYPYSRPQTDFPFGDDWSRLVVYMNNPPLILAMK